MEATGRFCTRSRCSLESLFESLLFKLESLPKDGLPVLIKAKRSWTRRFKDPYEYDPLPSKTSFRVLELLPGSRSDRIRCNLRLVDWENPPEYEALSYTWGDTTVQLPIQCGGKSLGVTTNLESGLRHLRYSDRPRLLWADAVW